MTDIRYKAQTDRFVFTFSYGNLAPAKQMGNPARLWEVETYGERIDNVVDYEENPKGLAKDEVHDLTAELKKLLSDNGVNYATGNDLRKELEGKSSEFWKKFFKLFQLTLRNTSWDSKTREYRVIGCTADRSGAFYDSRTAPDTLPRDADVNAAWNIARKTHIILRSIRNDGDKPQMKVDDKTWFAEAQGK